MPILCAISQAVHFLQCVIFNSIVHMYGNVSTAIVCVMQDTAVHSFVPDSTSDDHQLCSTSLPRTPIGLEEYVDKLKALILPQLRTRWVIRSDLGDLQS